jgi:hypothetical protein
LHCQLLSIAAPPSPPPLQNFLKRKKKKVAEDFFALTKEGEYISDTAK